jgi:predicted transcriptional regulator of viral defense system
MADHLSSIYVARRLHQSDLYYFTASLLADLLDLDRRRTYRLLARLKAEALVDEVEKGKYLLLGLEPERVLSNPLFIASHLVPVGYVSYWSALHFYGLTEQVPLTTFVATTKKKRPVAYHSFRFSFVTIKPHKFFGYRRESVGDLPVLVADREKAIVDSLDLPQHAGGITEAIKALQTALQPATQPLAEQTTDLATLIEYANRLGNKSLGSRLGYLLETWGYPTNGLIHSDSPVKLDPSRPRTGHMVPRWHVVVNVPQNEIAWGERVA